MVMFITLIGGEFHECIKMSKHIKLCNLNMCRFLSVNYTSIELHEKNNGFHLLVICFVGRMLYK